MLVKIFLDGPTLSNWLYQIGYIVKNTWKFHPISFLFIINIFFIYIIFNMLLNLVSEGCCFVISSFYTHYETSATFKWYYFNVYLSNSWNRQLHVWSSRVISFSRLFSINIFADIFVLVVSDTYKNGECSLAFNILHICI